MQVPLEDDSDSRFLIIDHFDQVDDFSGELLILKNMKQIGTDIIARMVYDHLKCETKNAKCKLFTLCTLHFAFDLVAGTSKISNFDLIRYIAKVIDFIESFIV